MHSTKLIKILHTLSKRELKAFKQYIASPFFNVNKQVIDLLTALKAHHPEYPAGEINKKVIYNKVFLSGNFSEQKLRYVMTDLTKLLEDYLIFNEFNQNTIEKKHYLLQSLNKRNLDKYFIQHLKDANLLQKQSRYRDINYYYNQALLEEDSYIFTSAKDNRTIDSSLQGLVDHIDIHYLSKKLRFTCEIINRQNILTVEYELPFLEDTLKFLKKNPLTKVPAIGIYYQILLTLQQSEEEEHYKRLILLLKQNIEKFSKSELRDMYAFAQNYCIRQVNFGNISYMRELFEIYKVLLDKKIIFEGKYLAQFDFKNIVAVALRLKEYDWVEEFIPLYKKNLRPDFRKNAINYNLARLHYARDEYRQALKLLQAVEFTDVYYHLDSKSLLLKTYYELEEIEPLLSLINTFRVFLRRNKLISEYNRTGYNNLIKFVKKLSKIKLGSKKSVKEVKAEIESVKQIADLSWLNSKVAELEGV